MLLFGPLSVQAAPTTLFAATVVPTTLAMPLVDLTPVPVIEVGYNNPSSPSTATGTLFTQALSAVIAMVASLATSFIAGASAILRMMMGMGL